MGNRIRKPAILGILTIILTLSLLGIQASANGNTPSTIEFMGAVPVSPTQVKVTYRLTSGDPVLKQWEIYSPCFTKDRIVSVSERYSLNPAQNRLRFTIQYGVGEVRDIEIVLKVDYYSMTLGMLDYKLQWDPYKTEGQVEGPTCASAPVFVVPETPLGAIGPLLSLLAAAGLLAAFKKNLIPIKLV